MCIRDSKGNQGLGNEFTHLALALFASFANFASFASPIKACLLYTSDAADERSSVDLGGRRIIKKKNHRHLVHSGNYTHKMYTNQNTSTRKDVQKIQ